MNSIWPQPLDPLHSVALSALAASLPLAVILVLMGGLRKSGLFASLCAMATAVALARGGADVACLDIARPYADAPQQSLLAQRPVARLIRQAVHALEEDLVHQRHPLLQRGGHAGNIVVTQQPLTEE